MKEEAHRVRLASSLAVDQLGGLGEVTQPHGAAWQAQRFAVETRRSMQMDFEDSGIPNGTFIREMIYLARKIGFFSGIWILNRLYRESKAVI